MKYIGFMGPITHSDLECISDGFFDVSKDFFLILANSVEEAKEILFEEIYNNQMHELDMGDEYSQLSERLKISYRSIRLDEKYHLSRDIE